MTYNKMVKEFRKTLIIPYYQQSRVKEKLLSKIIKELFVYFRFLPTTSSNQRRKFFKEIHIWVRWHCGDLLMGSIRYGKVRNLKELYSRLCSSNLRHPTRIF